MTTQITQQQEPSADTELRVPFSTWLKTFTVIFLLPALLLFGSAGTLRWPVAWWFLVLSTAGFAISRWLVWRVNPDLLRERGKMLDHDDTATFDKILSPLLALVAPVAIYLVAGFALRWAWQPVFPAWLIWLGVTLFVLGYIFGSWALLENRFFSGVVRIQTDRDHHVISSGPYAIVRHPGYASFMITYLGLVFMLDSIWTLIPFTFQMVVLVTRTALEDRTLQAELPGYAEYTKQTRFRLIPGIW